MQTALIDLGSSLSVTTPYIAKLSGATLVGGFNLSPAPLLNVKHDIFAIFFVKLSRIICSVLKPTIAVV